MGKAVDSVNNLTSLKSSFLERKIIWINSFPRHALSKAVDSVYNLAQQGYINIVQNIWQTLQKYKSEMF